MYLLDTNILSASAPTKKQVGAESFAAWMRMNGDRLYLSAITIAEIEAGIARCLRIAATTKAQNLRRWLAAVEHFHAGQILSFDIAVARHAGLILDRARGHDPGFEDITIAATAAAHGLTVLTANERHFEPLGVAFANPLKALPGR
ncbi:PIN domain-containing protein [Skermanella mucosa]|uniref:PIN domain-containing protein n=1 Tax=Skermanella mucosa TaxID=1789672 RepID=UPI00192BBA69|nr:PIN domain-containing protein [Skermanella mucosa]UEM24049.1 PIN domain-containing protein [Skermanella mucosa]